MTYWQIAKGEFENLKGLIYFTDGYGIYPPAMPAYDTIFVFLNEDDKKPEVPVWAIEVVLSEPDLEAFEEKEKEDECIRISTGDHRRTADHKSG